MDWPVIGAIGGVSVLAVAVTVAAVAMVRATPEPPKKVVVTGMAPLLRYESRPEVGILNGTQPTTLDPADYGPASQPQRVQPSTPQQAAPVRRNPPPEHVARPQPQPHLQPQSQPLEQLQSPTHGPVASRPLAPGLNPARPQAEPQRADQRYEGVLTLPEISRIKASMHLTPQQEPQWRPVEAIMRDIGRQQTAQIGAGQRPEVDPASVQRLYQAAQPLLATLRPDQKEIMRRFARPLKSDGFKMLIVGLD
jgi:hypothetical protein